MMKPIDRQVRETMQQLDQPYSSAYWVDALSHIEEMEKRRSRVTGFWWILAGIILISAGSLIWWSAIENKRMPMNLIDKQLAVIEQEEHPDIYDIESSDIKNEKLMGEINMFPNTNTRVTKKNTIDQVSGKNGGKQKYPDHSKTQVRGDQQTSSPDIEGLAESSIAEENDPEIKHSATVIYSNSEGLVRDKALVLPALSLRLLDNEIIWLFKMPEFESNAIVRPAQWSFNILTELSVLTNVPGGKDEKAILGAQGGMGVRMKAGSGFFTGITAGYAIRTGTFGNMLDHPTPEYVFEKKVEGFRLIPGTLSYAHSQLYAGWERGRWSGRAGVQGMYLAGATGGLYQYNSETSAEDPGVIISRVSKVSEGSISTPAFRKWVVELQAGLEFAISQRWKVTGQFAYTPEGLSHPLVESIYDPIAGRYGTTAGTSILKEQFLHIQLGIQYSWR